MPYSVNYVCFNCRNTARRHLVKVADAAPLCPHCEREMVSVGDRYRVPPQTDVKAWEKLSHQFADDFFKHQQSYLHRLIADNETAISYHQNFEQSAARRAQIKELMREIEEAKNRLRLDPWK